MIHHHQMGGKDKRATCGFYFIDPTTDRHWLLSLPPTTSTKKVRSMAFSSVCLKL